MPGLVQRVPLGLIDFLGLQSSGGNPVVLPDQLLPTIDLTEFYQALRWEVVVGQTAAIGATGGFAVAALTVPSGFVWLCDQLHIAGSPFMPAGTGYRLRIGVQDLQTTAVIAMSSTSSQAGVGERIALGFGGRIIMQANQAPLVYAEQTTVGTPQVFDVHARICRLRV